MSKKKNTLKEETPTTPLKEAARTKMPAPLMENAIDVQFGKKDLADLVTLLSISSQTYEILAREALRDNNTEGATIMVDRAKLSQEYATKLAAIYGMGEATSREVH